LGTQKSTPRVMLASAKREWKQLNRVEQSDSQLVRRRNGVRRKNTIWKSSQMDCWRPLDQLKLTVFNISSLAAKIFGI
jgi:hypothetical protein